MIGKQAQIPDGLKIGTNCIIHPKVVKSDFPGSAVEDGSVVTSAEADSAE